MPRIVLLIMNHESEINFKKKPHSDRLRIEIWSASMKEDADPDGYNSIRRK